MLAPVHQRAQEWSFLQALSVLDGRPGAHDAARALAETELDFDYLTVQALRHHLAPAMWRFLVDNGIENRLSDPVLASFGSLAQICDYRTEELIDEASRVADAMAAAGARLAFTKGVVNQSTLYDNSGTRVMADIDLMIPPDSTAIITETLTSLGYSVAKEYDARTNSLVDLPRSRRMVYRMYPDHLPHFTKLTGNRAQPLIEIDVAFSLTWFSSAWQIPMDAVLRDLDSVLVRPGRSDRTLPTLTPAYSLLFIVLHLFREAWFITKKPVRLNQFADVVRLWRRIGANHASEIIKVVEDNGVGPAVGWVCHHVDAMFDTDMAATLGTERYAEPRWLTSGVAEDGSFVQWHGDMRARLAGGEPVIFTPAGEPPFGAAARGR